MSIGLATGSFAATGGQAFSLSALFTVTPDSSNPQYVVVSGLDRNEYTVSATGSMGTFSGNGATTGYSSIGGDGYGSGIVFTYNATTGQYVNTTYGNLANVVMTASRDTNRNEAISLFAGSSATTLTQYANNPYALSQVSTYLGTVSVVTQPSVAGSVPGQATPASIANTAMSFVGQAWNNEGCWVLASNISAEAGASLPLTSTSVGVPGVANGEWIVAYNGPAGQGGDWQSMVKAGEIVSFATSSTSGHITTVVSGSGSTAMLVDNITYTNANGSYANSANDGSSKDVIVAAPHLASQEFSQAVAGSVVIYELDTPVIAAAGGASVAVGGSIALSSLFSASDPGTRAVTQYQVYDTGSGGATADTFQIDGATQSAHSLASAVTVSASSLSSATLQAASSSGNDTVLVRAFNGKYWGDWAAVGVSVSGSSSASNPAAPAASQTPVVTAQTANQVWRSTKNVKFTLAANTFSDPQGLALTYTAAKIAGPGASWLKFNSATQTFSGKPNASAKGTITISVTATDSAGRSASETFNVTMAPTAARFAQAISALHSTGGVGAATSAVTTGTPHTLASPVA